MTHTSEDAGTAEVSAGEARSRQQQAITKFAASAVSTPDVRSLQSRAVRLIQEVLGVEEVVIWELLPDEVLRVAACDGVPNTSPGLAMRTAPRSHLALTLVSGQPTFIDDWSLETRFIEEAARFGREVLSGLVVAVPGVEGPCALLAAYSHRARHFTGDETHWLQMVANIIATRMERQIAIDALATDELRYRLVVMATAQMVWVTDASGAVIGKTEAWVELSGQSAEEAAGEGWIEAIQQYDRERIRQAWHHALERQTRFQEEAQIRVRDGAYRYFLLLGAPVLDAQGALIEWIGTLTDIHERRRADDAVKLLSDASKSLSSSLDYQATVTAIAEGFVPRFADWCFIDSVSDDGTVCRLAQHHSDPGKLDIAAKARARYGAKNSEEFIRTVARVGQPILIPIFSEEVVKATAIDDEHYSYISQIPPRACVAVPLRVRGRVFGVITFVQSDSYRRFDDHDLAFAEELGRRAASAIENATLYEHLVQMEARYRGLLEAAPDAMVVVNEDGEIVLLNVQAEKQFGYRRDELVGQKVTNIIPEGFAEQLIADALRFEEGAQARQIGTGIELSGRRKDGSKFPIEMMLSPLESAEGTLVTAAIRDITMRKKAEAHLQAEASLLQKVDELNRSNQELEQFAYIASHDLQEPLRMVASYTQLLSRRYKGRLDSDADEFIAFAVEGACRMESLIKDLLAYSRVGTRGENVLDTSSEEALQKALFNLRGAVEEGGALVTYDPLPTVFADQRQLIQLFQNLVGNAIKYQSPGRASRVHISAATNSGKEWVFSVQDNGLGIESKYFEKIFGMFQRLHKREEFAGTGIGLAICKKIVERHGGTISVESQPGQGSTFRFSLAGSERK